MRDESFATYNALALFVLGSALAFDQVSVCSHAYAGHRHHVYLLLVDSLELSFTHLQLNFTHPTHTLSIPTSFPFSLLTDER